MKGTGTLKRKVEEAEAKIAVIDYSKGLSTSSTLINLAMTGRATVGLLPGFYYRFVGASRSGKTFLLLCSMAQASINPAYDDYDLIYDGPEDGALMDLRKFYGQRFADRVRPPSKRGPSRSVEEFYYNVDDALQSGKPFFYGEDSMDCLTSESEVDKFQQNKSAFLKGREAPGSYGDGKAKKNSSGLRTIIPRLKDNGSILVLISQSRDDITGGPFKKETSSGGKALTFYSAMQVWTAIRGHITKKVRGRDMKIAQVCRFHVDKTRVTGQDRTVEVPIYPSFGIDDMGSMVAYLIEWKHWEGKADSVVAPEFDFTGSREELVQKIEGEDREDELRQLVVDLWGEIEAACAIKRKPRY